MFDVLISSSAPLTSGSSRGMVSAALHLLVIAGAIRVTAEELPAVVRPREITAIFVVPHARPSASSAEAAARSLVAPAPVVALPAAPSEVPTSIPPVTIGPILDPARLRAALHGEVPGGTAGQPPMAGGVLTEREVDEPAQVVRQPTPRYPAVLQQAQVEGRVLVEFVIDTAGHLEAGSLVVIESSHRGFEAAAIETLMRSLFRPARIRGQAVRQRTTQSVVFRIRP